VSAAVPSLGGVRGGAAAGLHPSSLVHRVPADQLGTEHKTLRRFLRSSDSGITPPGQGARYEIQRGQVKTLAAKFKRWETAQAEAKAARENEKAAQAAEEIAPEDSDDPTDDPTDEELEELTDEIEASGCRRARPRGLLTARRPALPPRPPVSPSPRPSPDPHASPLASPR